MSRFTQSENVGELISALAKAQLEFGSAIKDSDNPFFKSKYADLAANINAVRPALNKHGIAIIQADSSELERAIARVRTSLHCGEQWIASEAEAPAIDKAGNINVQTLGSAWTYLRRYTLQALCGLASEDDDGNSLANGMKDGKKPEQVAAEEKWPEPKEVTLKDRLVASNKVEAEKRAAEERTKLADEQGEFSIDGDVLTCIVKGIQMKPGRNGGYMSVTLNGRLPNAANYASCFDKKLEEPLEQCVGKKCKLRLQTKDKYINVVGVLWIEGVEPSEPADIIPFNDIPF